MYWRVRSPSLYATATHRDIRRLREKATTLKLEILCEYIDDQLMSNSCWMVREWSCYRQFVRTNNDCEDPFGVTF
ncbi:hypothetical protein MAR_003756 [Mya arenaria]|uniref:Uncharacterized protein n=1 Tax=Mya arenaria TaxID=6604 RepID=A0ABY7GAD8_MYAAR|nr:hypothetical protein MAR_003756 [Mya arenaria]